MPRRPRISLANALLAFTCLTLAVGWWSTVEPPPIVKLTDRPPSAAGIRMLPLTISASEFGSWSGGWYLSVNSAGDGEMAILDEPRDIVQPVKISAAQIKELKDTLIQEQFFSLEEEFGQIVPDGSTKSLTINVGEWSKTVRVHFLGNWLMNGEKEKLRDPARALRVWMLIRGWFTHPDANDSRVYDQKVLDAVKAPTNGS
jgi:hypothetical protein